MDSTSTCSNCRFWKPREEPGTGKCKWGPPIYLPTGNGGPSRAAWPTTPGSEFCFRWESYTPSKLELTNDQRQANIEHEKEIKSMKREGVKAAPPKEVLNPEIVSELKPVVESMIRDMESAAKAAVDGDSAPTSEVLNPEFENKDSLPSALIPGPAEKVLNVGLEPVPSPKLFDNQIAQLVRGKRRPGERIE